MLLLATWPRMAAEQNKNGLCHGSNFFRRLKHRDVPLRTRGHKQSGAVQRPNHGLLPSPLFKYRVGRRSLRQTPPVHLFAMDYDSTFRDEPVIPRVEVGSAHHAQHDSAGASGSYAPYYDDAHAITPPDVDKWDILDEPIPQRNLFTSINVLSALGLIIALYWVSQVVRRALDRWRVDASLK